MTALPADLLTSLGSAQLTCRVDSNPPSEVVWYHNDLLLSKVATLARNSSYQTVILEDVTRDTIGRWQCVASNSLGRESDTVEVWGRPYSVTLNTVDTTNITELHLNWTVVSLSPISNTTIQYREWGEDWTTITRFHHSPSESSVVTSYSHGLTNLRPDTQYEIRLYCTNLYGQSDRTKSVYARTRKSGGDTERFTADNVPGQLTRVPSNVVSYAKRICRNVKRKIMNLEQRMDGWMELMRTRNGCEGAGEDGSLLVFMFSLAALTSL